MGDHDATSRHGHGPLALGALLTRATEAVRRSHGRLPAALFGDWESIVGPTLAARCMPLRLVRGQGGGALYLAVDGPAALELQHLAPLLIERINTCLGQRAVKRLVLRPGRLSGRPARLPLRDATGPAGGPPPAPDLDAALAALRRAVAARNRRPS